MTGTHPTQTIRPPTFKIHALGAFLTAGIIFLVVANGFFTYSGAKLYINETLYAVLFAVAVQFAIAATLIALPYIRGFGRIVMLLVYTSALALSTLSAFTYIYSTSHPDGNDVHAVHTQLKATISTQLANALKNEQSYVEASKDTLLQTKRSVDEEARLGFSSGKGPGKGSEYYQKLESYEDSAVRHANLERHFLNAQGIYEEINQTLTSEGDNALQREKLIILLSKLSTKVSSDDARNVITNINKTYLGQVHNPVERAITALMDPNQYSITVIVSIIWAAIFDLLALFIGIIRYYLLKPDDSVMQNIYQGIVNLTTLLFQFGNVRQEARIKSQQKAMAVEAPINSQEMQSFATFLLAGSQLSLKQDSDDPTEPLRTLTRYIEPLALAKPSNSIGIPYETVHEETRLKTLIALLVQTGVLINDLKNECYILNASREMKQKVLVFIRIGMKNQPEELDNVQFMLGERGLAFPSA